MKYIFLKSNSEFSYHFHTHTEIQCGNYAGQVPAYHYWRSTYIGYRCELEKVPEALLVQQWIHTKRQNISIVMMIVILTIGNTLVFIRWKEMCCQYIYKYLIFNGLRKYFFHDKSQFTYIKFKSIHVFQCSSAFCSYGSIFYIAYYIPMHVSSFIAVI